MTESDIVAEALEQLNSRDDRGIEFIAEQIARMWHLRECPVPTGENLYLLGLLAAAGLSYVNLIAASDV